MKRNYFQINNEASSSSTTSSSILDNYEETEEIIDDEEMTELEDEHDEDIHLIEVETETSQFNKWQRPQLKKVDSQKDNIIFQQLDIDNYEECSSIYFKPVFRLYGVNAIGNSVMTNVHGFYPYIYAKINASFSSQDCMSVRDVIIREIRSKPCYQNIENPIVSIDCCLKSNIYGYSKNEKSHFIKITVALPKLLPVCTKLLEEGIVLDDGVQNFQVFDNNIDFFIRYMVDANFVGCSWVELPAGSYTIRCDNKISHCQLEVDIDYDKIIYHSVDSQWSDIAPLRIISIDIECAGRKGIFPDFTVDSVIQISNIMIRYGESEPIIKCIFTLKTCAPIVGCDLLCYDTEEELLENWSKFIREVDPDVIIGYNIQNFDLPYLINRAKHLKINVFPYLGRIKNGVSKVTATQSKSKQIGRRKNKMVKISGRIQFDLFQILIRDYKLRSYSLSSVSLHFLGEQMKEYSFQIISELQNGDQFTRCRLALYCLKDSYTVIRLLNKLMCVVNYMEMARVTGVPLSYLLSHGQQIKVMSQLLRKAATQDFVIPDYKLNETEEYSGGFVIEPKRDFYAIPIATLDFSSLYPSIMMAHNLCYTSLIKSKHMLDSLGISHEDYVETPCGSFFVKRSVKQGLLPEILFDLIEARKKAKQELALETDPFKKQVLDGRQLALKVSANSVYGFTGSQKGRLPCLDICSSVTAYGREMIKLTKTIIEDKYTVVNGYANNAEVIYGDTDSVMCKFGVTTVREAIDLGYEAADFISRSFENPIKLQFENVYCPYLLINKKRYAGISYTKPDKYDKMECKGLESVRRDNCPLVSNLMNTCLEKLLIHKDSNSAIEYARSVISDLLCNRVDISQLIISKELTKFDKAHINSNPHSAVTMRMYKRDPGSAPQIGDRVPYIIIAGNDKNISSRAEDPIYVFDNNIPIDTNYYLNNQLINPLLRLFEPVFKTRTKEKLTKGIHMLTKTQQPLNIGPLQRFVVIKEKCISCSNVLAGDDHSICQQCSPQAHNIYAKEATYLSVIEDRFARLWTECQRCSGSLHQEVLCISRDCPIFYMRKTIQNDIIRQEKLVNKLEVDLDW